MSLPVLRTLAAQCLKAQDGRGEWRPVRAAIAAMVAEGTPHAIASDCAHAVADLAAWLRTYTVSPPAPLHGWEDVRVSESKRGEFKADGAL